MSSTLALATLFLVGATWVLASRYQYHLSNDTISYFSLAKKYLAGDPHAINSYWSPLFPMLIATGMRIGLSDVGAARIVLLIAGIVALIASERIMSILSLEQIVRRGVLIAITILIASFILDVLTPDLLFAAFILAYLSVAVRSDALLNVRSTCLCALFAVIAYYAKSVALPLFLAHFLLLAIEGCFAGNRRKVFWHAMVGIALFLLLTAPWMTLINLKQGHFTIGESARVIHASFNPLRTQELPIHVRGLLPPPDDMAVSIWDDPTSITHPYWVPWESRAAFINQLKIIILNALDLTKILASTSWALPVTLIALLVLCVPLFPIDRERRWARVLLSAIVLLIALYLPLVTDLRYFWFVLILSVIVSGAILSQVIALHPSWFSPLRRTLALTLLALSSITMPLWNLAVSFGDGREVAAYAQSLDQELSLHGKRLAADRWKNGLQIAHHVRGKYFGQPRNLVDGRLLEEELLAANIDAYLVWGTMPVGLKQFSDATSNRKESPHVFVRE